MRNDVTEVERFVALLNDGYAGSRITCAETHLPFPADLDDSRLRSIVGDVPHTPLALAVEESVGLFRRLLNEGRIDLRQLDA